MIEPQTKEIDGNVYQFTPLMAKAARDQLDQLTQKFGPSLASAVKGLNSASGIDPDSEIEVLAMLPVLSGALGGAIESFSSALTGPYHANLVRTFFNQVTVQTAEGGQQKLTEQYCELHFATRLLTETKVLLWCLEVQYADFFEFLRRGITAIQLRLEKTKASPSNSPTDSTGSSTESLQASTTVTL